MADERDERFRMLDALIALGYGDMPQDLIPGRHLYMLRRRLHPRRYKVGTRPGYERPEVRRRIYLEQKFCERKEGDGESEDRQVRQSSAQNGEAHRQGPDHETVQGLTVAGEG